MIDKEDIAGKTIIVFIIVFFLAVSGFFGYLFFNCVDLYSKFEVDRSDLMYAELTFDKYEKIYKGKGGYVYKIYFNEFEDSFQINRISNKKLDKAALDNLSRNEIVKVYFCESSNRYYNYEICEISSKNTMLLSLSDYINANQSNQIAGMIFCPIMVFIGLLLAWIFVRTLKPAKANSGLGRIRIEYKINEDIIRVYNSVHVCSLVINDKIFDQYLGIYGSNFRLSGTIRSGGKTVRVEARMGVFNMRLYCNGHLVAKRFMAFG